MKWLRWTLTILAAMVGGAVLRLVRRAFRRPPRIWHGFSPLHATSWMVAAERAAGYPSLSVIMNLRKLRYPLVRSDDFDAVFEAAGEREDDAHWRGLVHLLWNADIWNAYFDSIFFRHDEHAKNTIVFRLIRLAGIRIVVQPHGSDLLCLGRYASRYAWPERAQKDYPLWDLSAYRAVVETRVDLFTRFAHLVLAGDSIYEEILPRWDLSFHTVPVDTDALRPVDQPEHRIPVIIHAPNHRNVKGTDVLLEALETLRKRGFEYELRLIEGVARDRALAMYADADVIADQFMIGAFGIFALEGLALGKPVLTYLDEQHLRRSQYVHPIVNTTPENIVGVLAALHAVPELRIRIGTASRASVVKYQSFESLMGVWSRIYDHVWWGTPLDVSTTAPFSTERAARSLSEDPALPEFWPIAPGDLIVRIRAALQRVGWKFSSRQ
ncbi:MAG TPA: glycosyltransferase [Woeseiaceae bacterium]